MAIRSPWLEKYQPGSFRGVDFIIRSHNFSGGRRTQDHEFAERDESRVRDLGRKIRKFSIEMVVLGDDYFNQRDALQEALEKPGPGELIHPYLGRLNVQAGDFTISESFDEGRIARFTCDFTEAGQTKFPESVEDEARKVETNANDIIDKSKTAFEKIFDLANQPAHVVQDAADKVSGFTTFMEKSVAKFTAPITNLAFALSNLRADVNDLIRAPDELAQRIQDAFDLLTNELSDNPETANKVHGNLNLFGDDFEPILGDTPSKNAQRDNSDALTNLVREQAFANNGKTAINTSFGSIQDAVIERDKISENVETHFGNVLDDDLFQSLKDFQSSLSKGLPSVDLGNIVTFTPPVTLPALVIVHTLFQDLSKEDELISQNNVRHPGFVPGGDELEIASG